MNQVLSILHIILQNGIIQIFLIAKQKKRRIGGKYACKFAFIKMVFFEMQPDTKLWNTQIYVALCFWETTLPQAKLGNLSKAGHLQLTACSPDANIPYPISTSTGQTGDPSNTNRMEVQLWVNAQIQLKLYLNFRPQCLHHPPDYQLPICKSIAFLPPHVKNEKYDINANTVEQSTIANPQSPTRVPQLPTCKNIVFLPPPPAVINE